MADRLLEVALLRGRKLGDLEGAREAARRAVSIAPSHPAARAELDRLEAQAIAATGSGDGDTVETAPVELVDPEAHGATAAPMLVPPSHLPVDSEEDTSEHEALPSAAVNEFGDDPRTEPVERIEPSDVTVPTPKA